MNTTNDDSDFPAWSFETLQIHAGQHPDSYSFARALPLYNTTSFVFRDTNHAAALFSLTEEGNCYTRLSNPTTLVVEERIAALEKGVAALLVSSGQAAASVALLNLAEVGSHIVSSPRLYGGTQNLLQHTLAKLGITVTFVDDPDDVHQWEAAIRPETKAFFAESISNPLNDVLDISGVATVAHRHGIALVVDNTVATPYLLNPLTLGADVVVHSATKYLAGHGTVIAGVIVDGGTFDWASGRYPHYTLPDPSYHGLVWVEQGPAAFALKARTHLLRDLGPALSPFNAFLVAQGLETLSLRMERHCANALTVARFLSEHPQVRAVSYAGLPTSPWHERALALLPRGYGAVVAFEIEGGEERAHQFVNSLRLHSHVANIGDVRSLVIHPSSTTHSQLTAHAQRQAGVTPGLIRLAVGLEGIDDIVEDLRRGFQGACQ